MTKKWSFEHTGVKLFFQKDAQIAPNSQNKIVHNFQITKLNGMN